MPEPEQQACLEADLISGFLEDRLSTLDRDRVAQHLVACEACRDQFTELARDGAVQTQSYNSVVMDEGGTGFALPSGTAAGALPPGSSLGRYVVLSKVGAGGMGVVYSAYDPELHRKIAIKVIRTEVLHDTERAHANLRDEARAMAQLTHPNVVRVYDVGTQGQLVYIAMEFIEGESLLQFARRHQARGEWRPILDACLQAGRGLQAAHEAGLVHRDFKPNNVLIGKDGRAYVADFGLTRLFSKAPEGGEVGWTSATGTPGYAPPEQIAGMPFDVRSDQYSFCVTAAECLFRRDPMSIIIHLEDPKRQGLRCPKSLGPVLERGLARRAAARHGSMQELIDLLEARADQGRRRMLIGGAVAAFGTVGLLMFTLGARASSPDDPCATGAERFARIWDQKRHDKLDAALLQTQYARQASYFLNTVHDLSGDLAAEQKLSCAATFKSKTQSTELFDRQMFCLNSQATELEAIVAMVEDGASVEVGQSALGSLPSVAECRVTESLLATRPPPTDAKSLERIQSVEEKLAQRRALQEAREPQAALEAVQQAIVEANALGYDPLTTRAELVNADLLESLERYPEARLAAERARDSAAQGRDTRRLIVALLRLASIVSTHEDDDDEAAAYLATARSLSLGIELPTIDAVNVEITSGRLAKTSGKVNESVHFANQGLALLPGAVDDDKDLLNAKIDLLQIIAAAHFAKNDFDNAGPLLRTILELETRSLGPEHSHLAVSLTNMASIEYKLNRLEEALVFLRRARELLRSPDAKRADIGQALSLQALIENHRGNLPEAVSLFEQTIEVYREHFGDDHANIWRTKANLANTLMALERWSETLDIQRGFLAWTERRYGADSPTAIAAKLNLAGTIVHAYFEEGEVQEAQQIMDEMVRDLPEGDPNLVGVRLMQGNAFLALEQYAAAADSFEESLRLAETTPHADVGFTATTTGSLAGAQWQAGNKERALATARRALQHYDKLLPEMADQRAAQETWLIDMQRELDAKER